MKKIVYASVMIAFATVLASCARKVIVVSPKAPRCAESVDEIKRNIRVPNFHQTVDMVECIELLEAGYRR